MQAELLQHAMAEVHEVGTPGAWDCAMGLGTEREWGEGGASESSAERLAAEAARGEIP